MDLEGIPSYVHEVLGEGNTNLVVVVLALHDAAVAVVIGDVGAEGVEEAVGGAVDVRGVRGKEGGGATHAK